MCCLPNLANGSRMKESKRFGLASFQDKSPAEFGVYLLFFAIEYRVQVKILSSCLFKQTKTITFKAMRKFSDKKWIC